MRAIGLTLLAFVLGGCRSASPDPVEPLGVTQVAGMAAEGRPPDPSTNSSVDAPPATTRASPAWAESIVLPGLPNLHRVSPTLYRGAQPEEHGFDELKNLGVRTVVSLRAFHHDPTDLGGMQRESIPFKFWHPEDEDVVRFLRIATDPARQPVFVHCEHGSDRTGMMIAIWRVAVEGWSKDEALREMTEGPFGYHPSMEHLVKYVRQADVAELCRKAGFECSTSRARDS